MRRPTMKWYMMIILPLLWQVQAIDLAGQEPILLNSGEIQLALKRLLTVGNVLYIAAHPDDENTAVLAYMAKERHMRAAYLSLTRGAGGQNLIGTERGETMSVLRTYELLEARKIDGAEQFFTRALDFGYSKTAAESMAIWGKDNVLGDMVYIIRKFRPDIILSRFPNQSRRGGHGHHAASAVLAVEAFHAAGDPTRFPEQLKSVTTWAPRRIFWNTWTPYLKETKPEEIEELIAVDVGAFNRLLGKSYHEIAALSRSMHKSQGFGATPRRGERLDYFDLLAGDPAEGNLLSGIDTTWGRVPGADAVRKLLETANRSFNPESPHTIIPTLMEALDLIRGLTPSVWTWHKQVELLSVIRSCAGLWIEATAPRPEVCIGEEIPLEVIVINRSPHAFILKEVTTPDRHQVTAVNQPLFDNKPLRTKVTKKIGARDISHPYWLKEQPGKGLYRAGNSHLTGKAREDYPIVVQVTLAANNREVTFIHPVLFRWRDPVRGERVRELIIAPPATARFTDDVFYLSSDQPRAVTAILRSGSAPVSGEVRLTLPTGWRVTPDMTPFSFQEPLLEKKITFMVRPPARETTSDGILSLRVNGETFSRSRVEISHQHLPPMTIHPRAVSRFVRLHVNGGHRTIGYIMGSGDDIPGFLRQIGYRVDLLSDDDLREKDLTVYEAIITGIRAYNTREGLKFTQKRLLDYVQGGGRLIVQYNTNRNLKLKELGPYPFRISRYRVAEEDAPLSILSPDHPLLRHPNPISQNDFSGWVQERGLYFADTWDPRYLTPLSSHDSGEDALAGGLLVCRFGKGTYIYTGYSFFRQLPAGVAGAFKLFVNMINCDIIPRTQPEKGK